MNRVKFLWNYPENCPFCHRPQTKMWKHWERCRADLPQGKTARQRRSEYAEQQTQNAFEACPCQHDTQLCQMVLCHVDLRKLRLLTYVCGRKKYYSLLFDLKPTFTFYTHLQRGKMLLSDLRDCPCGRKLVVFARTHGYITKDLPAGDPPANLVLNTGRISTLLQGMNLPAPSEAIWHFDGARFVSLARGFLHGQSHGKNRLFALSFPFLQSYSYSSLSCHLHLGRLNLSLHVIPILFPTILIPSILSLTIASSTYLVPTLLCPHPPLLVVVILITPISVFIPTVLMTFL